MGFLSALWLPILLSSVFVFVVSSVIHMVVQGHKKDYTGVPNEGALLDAMRAASVGPGNYMFPHASSFKEAGSPEMVEKFSKGPVGILLVTESGPPTMTKSLMLWFIYSLIVGVFTAYIGAISIGWGADYLLAFRVTGAVAVVAYSLGHMHDAIWKFTSWGTTLRFMLDGVIYGLVTAGTFGWLWPSA